MRKLILLTFVLFILTHASFATDFVVQQGGPVGTYSSINSAVSAASDGDRILIVPRPGGVAWQEDVIITKSLEFLPGVDGTRYIVEGNYTISPTNTGKVIKIVGMENVLGDIAANSNAPTGPRAQVSIIGCDILGDINFDRDYYDVLVAHNILVGNVYLRYGNVIGNDMLGFEIQINTDGQASDDVLQIVGNRAARLEWYSNSQFFYVANNYFYNNISGNRHALLIEGTRNSGSEVNVILNNSLVAATSSTTQYCLYLNSIAAPSAKIDIINNAVDEISTASTYGIRSTSVTAAVYLGYNHVDVSFSYELTGVIDDGTNVTNNSFTISNTGVVTGSLTTNGGHPATQYFDIDLTRNDVGCYGGSFTQSNYFPITAGPHVIMMRWPRGIYQGNTLSIEADGYDR